MTDGRDEESQDTRSFEDHHNSIKHRTNAIRAGTLLALIMLIVAAGACAGGLFLVKRDDSFLAPAAFIVAAFFLFSAAVVPLILFRESCIDDDEHKKCERDCRILEDALDKIRNRTLSGLAKANFRQMRMFTLIATKQARMSYYASLAAASVSLLVLASGGAVTVGLAGTTGKVVSGSLTAVGVAMAGFLSATFLKTYWMAARQMSYYYGQPLVHCYLLHAEWLTLMLTEHPEWKVDIDLWQRVVTAAIEAGKSAQSHLLSMQEDSPTAQNVWRAGIDVAEALMQQDRREQTPGND
jgi:hypothetical protein